MELRRFFFSNCRLIKLAHLANVEQIPNSINFLGAGFQKEFFAFWEIKFFRILRPSKLYFKAKKGPALKFLTLRMASKIRHWATSLKFCPVSSSSISEHNMAKHNPHKDNFRVAHYWVNNRDGARMAASLWGRSLTTLTKICPYSPPPTPSWHKWTNSITHVRENMHTIGIFSATYLPCQLSK